MVKPESFLSAPIPGQSLTDTPRNYPWENPPQMADYEEVTKYYINRMANQDVMDDIAVLFEGGMPIAPFVESVTTMGVMEGLHSIDVSLIVAPVLHAFIKAAMLEYGIDAKDDTFNPDKDPTERENRRLMTAIQLALAEAEGEQRTADTDPGIALLQQVSDSMDADTEDATEEVDMQEAEPAEEVPVEPAPRGLMARGAM
jgi:hypothetical protein